MSASKDTPMVYAASVNPPRRAKRQRTSSLAEGDAPAASPTTPVSPPQQRRAPSRPQILPKPVADRDYTVQAPPDSDSGSEEEDNYDPGRDAVAAPKRRGRKPGTMSRTARESLRKLNHSRIEKARRTKINETLSTLSTLVNERGKVLPTDVEEVSQVTEEENGKKGKGKAEEKEFKLDVLVKTVEYMQDLVTRVQALESKMCTQCRLYEDADVPPSPKRRRPAEDAGNVEHTARRPRHTRDEDDSYIGDDEHGLGATEEELPSPMPFVTSPASASRSTTSPHLPPIASWLPHPYVDPSSFITSSNAPPSRSPANSQLPSPPPSGRFPPAATLANMPALTLPAPAHPLAPSQPQKGASQDMPPPRQQRKSVSTSPTVSPMWTPEDETAASLLLQMSFKQRSSSISSTGSTPAPVLPMTPVDETRPSLEVVTPGSLLGMRD